LFFITGLALTLYYILPTRLGYQVVNLENEIQSLERQQKLFELEIARSRSLGRIENLATTNMAMLPMENKDVIYVTSETEVKSTKNSNQMSQTKVASVNSDENRVSAGTSKDSNLFNEGKDQVLQAAARLISGKYVTASRGAKVNSEITD
jgi:CRISPR/Cas system Type II protein with McrA/HNH and RuvC-like nuclease domain